MVGSLPWQTILATRIQHSKVSSAPLERPKLPADVGSYLITDHHVTAAAAADADDNDEDNNADCQTPRQFPRVYGVCRSCANCRPTCTWSK